MIKRIFVLFLALTLVTAGMIFPTTAASGTQTINSVRYTTVSTSAELASALATGGNILLTADIELGNQFQAFVRVKPGTLINGDGHSLTFSQTRQQPLFVFEGGSGMNNATVTIVDLNFGTQAKPFKMSGSYGLFADIVGMTNADAKAEQNHTIFRNVNFFVDNTSASGTVAALYNHAYSMLDFSGCILTTNIAGATSGVQGAWIGIIDCHVTMTSCTTKGSVKGSSVGGFIGQLGHDSILDANNCYNLADLESTGFVGGFVGNSGTGASALYITNCKNYGSVTSVGTSYGNMAGGFIGRLSNRSAEEKLNVVYDSVNYGTITSGSSAGGFMGRFHDYDFTARPRFTFRNCLNVGDVNGKAYAGGIVGVLPPLIEKGEFTDCANIGAITSDGGYAGNIGGMLNNSTVNNCVAAGVVTSTAENRAGVISGLSANNYTAQAGSAGSGHVGTNPVVADTTYFGELTRNAFGATKATDVAALIEALSERYGVELLAAPASAAAKAHVILATPRLVGTQVKVDGDKLSLRLVGAIDSKDAFRQQGILITVTSGNESVKTQFISRKLYTSVTSGDKVVTAESLSAEYLYAAVVPNLPTTGTVTVRAQAYGITTDGTKYKGDVQILTLVDGQVDEEFLLLNGTRLSEFSVVYAVGANMAVELQLATRLANKIGELVGGKVDVILDQQQRTPTGPEINVGKTNRVTTAPAGRSIFTLDSDKTSIAITGDDLPMLSESLQYFIDTVLSEMVSGKSAIDITEKIEVPVDTKVSIMAYNMGANDNANIKKAEWDLILDHLPDIVTSQEPWAGFLDDFLNQYAVMPGTSFQASSTDDDVMVSDVNNKAFTGRGYYGVYWGEPRWTPGVGNNNGKASYSIILYARDRFTVDESKSGTFWLSATPDQPGSVQSGSSFARCATYATLTDRNTGEQFVVVNVHLDFNESVQVATVKILLDQLKARVGTNIPIFITGDMNSTAADQSIKNYQNNNVMPMTSLDYVADRAYRCARNIDWLFTNKPQQVKCHYYRYCGEKPFFNNLWPDSWQMGTPSDLPAVIAEVTINTKS